MTKIFESIEEYEFALEDSFEQIKREIKYQVEVLNKEDTIEKIAEIEKGFSAFSHEFLAREDIAELLSFGEELESLSEKFYQNRLRLHLGMIEFVEDDVHDFINNIENKLDEIKLNSNNPKPQQHNIIIEKIKWIQSSDFYDDNLSRVAEYFELNLEDINELDLIEDLHMDSQYLAKIETEIELNKLLKEYLE